MNNEIDLHNMTDRIRCLYEMRNELYDSEVIPHRAQVYGEIFTEPGEVDRVTKTAVAFRRFLAERKISVLPEDILAGYAYQYTWDETDPHRTPKSYNPAERPPYDPYCIDDEVEKVRDCLRLDADSEKMKELLYFQRGAHNWLYKHNNGGHVIPGHERILKKGLKALCGEAETELEKNRPEAEKSCISAMLVAARAFSDYIIRYSDRAQELAQDEPDPVKKRQLQKISSACRNIAFEPPGSFFEAVQLVWLVHEILITDMPVNCVISFGRLDVYLDPFYRKDLELGLITENEAQEIIDALWLKIAANEFCYQCVTIGGYDMNENYIANPITYMMLRASKKLLLDQPLLALRFGRDIPEKLWEEAVELMSTGTGFPALYCDKNIIAVKKKQGLSHLDAVNYGIVGCVELTGCGNDYSNTESTRINIPLIIELMLNGGLQRITGEDFGLNAERSLNEIKSFDEFYSWFKDELHAFLNRGIDTVNLIESVWGRLYPSPFLSFTMDGCVKKGRDMADGGAVYNNSTVNATGFASAADSLAAIKKLVFDDQILSLSELAAVLDANFAGYEDLLSRANKCPKYGNDNDSVDIFVKDIVDIMLEVTGGRINSRGGTYGIGLYTVQDHVKMGKVVGALPDGRLSGTSLSNGMASVQGKDTQGPTALINSVLKSNIKNAGNNMVLDLKFSPPFLKKQSNRTALLHLVNAYFENGGMEIQFNVVSRETLLSAKKEPEKYKNLVVRVSGFSAYFNSLLPETQDEIIARTEYAGI